MRYNKNELVRTGEAPAALKPFTSAHLDEVRSHLECIDYDITPLLSLQELAQSQGVGAILVKDESRRSGLKSFKALGGAHAVVRVILHEAGKRLGRKVAPQDILSPEVQLVAQSLTITCATDGNHGRSVAAACKVAGCHSVIFVHAGVSESRANAIASLGAEVQRVVGSYDDSVAYATDAAQKNGWIVVSDTSWPGYEEIPTWVMQGYLVMADEIVQQVETSGCSLTHVFLQAGVGGFAAALAAYLTSVYGDLAPKIVVVEPEKAACIYESAIKGEATKINHGEATVMAMLECYEPSMVAWRILKETVTAFMTISDEDALYAMAAMAREGTSDPVIEGGESGAASLGGLLVALAHPEAKSSLGLNEDSVALVINTEGATDPELYAQLLTQAKALP
ncbi:diaminopropionate ammonia-lyase [Pseudomonas taiwanensis]|uniref:diaminopropionate ammonia-lyase n=1 Tax=Pseudomonas taiwanensis TaxID=470150 RepID=UPI00040439C1|nr:diaminopropionate ammonia-lyase [Pseudomonas taiwanensis]